VKSMTGVILKGYFVYLGRSYMERGGRARSLARSVVT